MALHFRGSAVTCICLVPRSPDRRPSHAALREVRAGAYSARRQQLPRWRRKIDEVLFIGREARQLVFGLFAEQSLRTDLVLECRLHRVVDGVHEVGTERHRFVVILNCLINLGGDIC